MVLLVLTVGDKKFLFIIQLFKEKDTAIWKRASPSSLNSSTKEKVLRLRTLSPSAASMLVSSQEALSRLFYQRESDVKSR